jgi:hypothetical protein
MGKDVDEKERLTKPRSLSKRSGRRLLKEALAQDKLREQAIADLWGAGWEGNLEEMRLGRDFGTSD